MDGTFFSDTYTVCQDAQAILRYLVDHVTELALGRSARIACLLSQPALLLKGEPADAVIASAAVQGVHRTAWLFFVTRFCTPTDLEPLEFVIYLDAAAWAQRGRDLEMGQSGFPLQREILIHHELLHLRQLLTPDGDPKFHEDGREMLALRRHTYEVFQEELTRYGPVTLGIEQLALDVVVGNHAERARHDAQRPKLRRVK